MNLAGVLAAPTIRCPACRGTQLRRSRLDDSDSVLVPLVLAPYRCIPCDQRFFTLSSGAISTLRAAVVFAIVLATVLGITYWASRIGQSPESGGAAATRVGGKPQMMARDMAGDAQMQFELAIRYLMGDGAPKDRGEALKWLEMAANGGHMGARYNLGLLYKSGFVVERDDGTAYRWFDLAARQNHADAQYQIALLHKEGVVVPLDLIKSYTWAHLSASQGHIDAVVLRDNLSHALTTQQMQDGLDAARGWAAAAKKAVTLSTQAGAAKK